ncbi:MAG: CRISPR-associated endonuclease Cas1 [Desulfobacterales bacterium S3730MH5]|nr:MAG: CRISPR-associated endonuclease Cas1 [Desulfobacterales bacterium S3730MH5]
MHTIYLTDNGLQLKKKSNRIMVKKDGKILEEIPILDLKRVLIFGNNQLSTELMRSLASKGIEVAFLSSIGRFKFRIVPETSKNIYLRMAQHDCYRDQSFRIRLSKTLVEAKLKNQRSFLIRYQRNQPKIDLQKSIEALRNYMHQISQTKTIEQTMGLEGIGARVYFEAYGKLLLGGFEFVKRQYYPAPDPINALLSFGYMLLFNELSSLLEAFGFDVFLGFLHSTKYGRASLATDMMEEFRSPVVDRLVIYLVNKGAIKPSQFTPKGQKGVKMDDRARKSYLANYEKFMTTTFLDVKTKKQKNYRQIIKEKVLEMERALLNNTDYTPYVFYS